jgi:sulfonate transport system permease protein
MSATVSEPEVVVGFPGFPGSPGADELTAAGRLGIVPGPASQFSGFRPAGRRVWRSVLRSRWSHLAGPLLLFAIWQLVVSTKLLPATQVPAPAKVIDALRQLISSGQLGTAMTVSLKRVALGLVVGIGGGSALALASGLTVIGEKLIDPVIHMLRTLPVLALLPLFVLWFGIGEEAKVLLIGWAVSFPIYINLFAGIRSVDPKLVEAGQVLGLSRLGQIRHVILPGALPQFLTGLRLAMGVSWLVLVAAEEVNPTSGLGYLITNAENLLQTNVIFAALLVYALLGLASDVIVRLIERWALAWRSSYMTR